MMRHPNDGERTALRQMVDDCGAAEIIGILAQIVAHDHPDSSRASDLRIALNKIGRELRTDRPMDAKPLIDIL